MDPPEAGISDPRDKVYIAIEACIAIFAFFGNSFLITLFLFDTRLRNNRNFFLISLSFANIMTCVLEVPFCVLTYFRMPKNDAELCYLEVSTIFSVRVLINYATAAIALDRLRAVKAPFEYRKNSSRKFSLTLIAFCWMIAMAVGFLVMTWTFEGKECGLSKFDTKDMLVKAVIGKLLPFVFIISCYALIVGSIYQLMKAQNAAQNRQGQQASDGKLEKRIVKATLKVTWVVVVLTLCEMPLNITHLLYALDIKIDRKLVYLFLILSHTTALLNPFLYAFNLRDFRRASQKFFNMRESSSSLACRNIHRKNANPNDPQDADSDFGEF